MAFVRGVVVTLVCIIIKPVVYLGTEPRLQAELGDKDKTADKREDHVQVQVH